MSKITKNTCLVKGQAGKAESSARFWSKVPVMTVLRPNYALAGLYRLHTKKF
jgi:hypothetical protein